MHKSIKVEKVASEHQVV